MGPPSYTQSVVDRNVVMRRILVRVLREREREKGDPNPEIRPTGGVASRTSNLKLVYLLKVFFSSPV